MSSFGFLTRTTADQPEWSEAEKRVAIESYHQHPENTIAIYVGNEDLVPFGTYTVDDLIGHMDGECVRNLMG